MKKTVYQMAVIVALLLGSLATWASVDSEFDSVVQDTHATEAWLKSKLKNEAGVRFTNESHDGNFYETKTPKTASTRKPLPKYRNLHEVDKQSEEARIAEELRAVRY